MVFKPPKTYPYGGGGLPKTKRFNGKTYYLQDWGPYKMPQVRLQRYKEIKNANSARQVKIGKSWVIYMR